MFQRPLQGVECSDGEGPISHSYSGGTTRWGERRQDFLQIRPSCQVTPNHNTPGRCGEDNILITRLPFWVPSHAVQINQFSVDFPITNELDVQASSSKICPYIFWWHPRLQPRFELILASPSLGLPPTSTSSPMCETLQVRIWLHDNCIFGSYRLRRRGDRRPRQYPSN